MKDGNAVTLVAKLQNINNYEAAKQINDIFKIGLELKGYSSKNEIKIYQSKEKIIEQYKKWENETFQLLCDYLHLLEKWKKEEPPFSDLYVEALQEIDKINYYLDLFINGTDEDKIWFWLNQKNVINKILIIFRKEI